MWFWASGIVPSFLSSRAKEDGDAAGSTVACSFCGAVMDDEGVVVGYGLEVFEHPCFLYQIDVNVQVRHE